MPEGNYEREFVENQLVVFDCSDYIDYLSRLTRTKGNMRLARLYFLGAVFRLAVKYKTMRFFFVWQEHYCFDRPLYDLLELAGVQNQLVVKNPYHGVAQFLTRDSIVASRDQTFWQFVADMGRVVVCGTSRDVEFTFDYLSSRFRRLKSGLLYRQWFALRGNARLGMLDGVYISWSNFMSMSKKGVSLHGNVAKAARILVRPIYQEYLEAIKVDIPNEPEPVMVDAFRFKDACKMVDAMGLGDIRKTLEETLRILENSRARGEIKSNSWREAWKHVEGIGV